jgi:hypothetical protein
MEPPGTRRTPATRRDCHLDEPERTLAPKRSFPATQVPEKTGGEEGT